jgi:hypothetical protein
VRYLPAAVGERLRGSSVQIKNSVVSDSILYQLTEAGRGGGGANCWGGCVKMVYV